MRHVLEVARLRLIVVHVKHLNGSLVYYKEDNRLSESVNKPSTYHPLLSE